MSFRSVLAIIFLSVSGYAFPQHNHVDSVDYWLLRADSLSWKSKYADVTKCAYNALRCAEATNSPCKKAKVFSMFGKTAYYSGNAKEVEYYFRRTLSIADSFNCKEILAKANYNLAVILFEFHRKEKEKTDSAEFYFFKSLKYLEKSTNYRDVSKTHSALSEYYMFKKKPYNVIYNQINEALRFAILGNDSAYQAFAYNKMGKLALSENRFNEAEQCFSKSLQLYKAIHATEGIMNALLHMAVLRDTEGKPGAFKFMKERSILRDSIFNAGTKEKIAEFSAKYETEKKEQQNKILHQENELKRLQLQQRNTTILILAIAILFIVVAIVWRLNAMNLKRKQEQLLHAERMQKEKERISRDLHDNVGGQLSFILYSLDGIEDDNKKTRTELSKNINESVRSVIQNLRETIWAINDESIKINDLSDRLKVYARSMFKNSNTKIIFSENIQSDILLNALVGLNLYRICQEIINNAFKYSNAGELKISIHAQEKVAIDISDNGIGFDFNQYDEGFGLKNIHDRAKEIGASISVNAIKNQGVGFTIVV